MIFSTLNSKLLIPLPLLLRLKFIPASASSLLNFTFCNSSTTTSTSTFISSTAINEMVTAFHQLNPRLLKQITLSISNINPNQVELILSRLKSNPNSAIKFFEWSENLNKGFYPYHPIRSYSSIFHILLYHQMFEPARKVAKRFFSYFGDSDIFASLSEGFRTYGTNPSTVYSFLVDFYCSNGMLEKSVDTYIRMSKLGIVVSPHSSSNLFNLLAKLGCFDLILKIYGELRNGYSIFMDLFVSNGEIDKCLKFHRALIERGFIPDIISCNKILNSLCKDNYIKVLSIGKKSSIYWIFGFMSM